MTITVYPPYGSGSNNPVYIAFPPTGTDAFARLRVSNPYTVFDSQNRYAIDPQFSTAITGTGTTTYLANESSVKLEVTSGGVGSVVRQSFRTFPYQPGKGLLVLTTFVLSDSTSSNLTQRVGYFNTNNGVFFQKVGSTASFVLRSYISGTASDARTADQSSWNGDTLDGTGPSGITLDTSKAQILWMDFEWLGVGSVRCGFVINGQFILCHTFENANQITGVYMTTAILNVRYEITSVTSAVAASMKQICSTVISEGGYQQTSEGHVARRTTAFANIDTAANFYPIVSVRLASTALGAVVLINDIKFQPTTLQNYEIALIKNPTLTGASWAAVSSDANVEMDVSATAISSAGTILQTGYIANTGGGGQTQIVTSLGYNWDAQIGVSLASVSDIFTLGVRTISGATKGDGVGAISFYDLTL